eukprot:c2534_g1_i1.p1 GENE.c2534_g1_i1~~c2534_g1_i1.p1  ORF type:complete len:549 (-),score=91.56 c2534_g1_i1:987-2594(-)
MVAGQGLLVILCALALRSQASTADRKNIIENLLSTGYQRDVPPYTDNGIVNVTFSLNITSIEQFDRSSGSVSFRGLAGLAWTDSRLMWKPSDFHNVAEITVPLISDTIWVPNVRLLNHDGPAEFLFTKTHLTTIRVSYDGSVLLGLAGNLSADCALNSVYMFPYDYPRCTLEFGTWITDDPQITLSFAEKRFSSETNPFLDLLTLNPDFAGWLENSPNLDPPNAGEEYKLYRVDTTIANYTHLRSTWFVLQYKITVRHHQSRIAIGYVVPGVLLFWMSCLTFWINPESRQRLFAAFGCLTAQFFVMLATPLTVDILASQYSQYQWMSTACFGCTLVNASANAILIGLYWWNTRVTDPGLGKNRLRFDPERNMIVPKNYKSVEAKGRFARFKADIMARLFIPLRDWKEMDETESLPFVLQKLQDFRLEQDAQRKELKKQLAQEVGNTVDESDSDSEQETFDEMIARKQIQAEILSQEAEMKYLQEESEVSTYEMRAFVHDWDKVFKYGMPLAGWILLWVIYAKVDRYVHTRDAGNI